MQKATKKRIIAIAEIAFLTAVMIAVGVVLAVLAKNVESRANNFSFSNAEIELTEPEWDKEPEDKIVYPGAVYSKDPTVKNAGSNDLYVYLEVKIPKGEVRTVETEDGKETVREAALHDLLTYNINDSHWVKIIDNEKDGDKDYYTKDDYHVCVYAYTHELGAGMTTEEPLFEKVTFSEDIVESELGKNTIFNMPVTAYAIQAKYIGISGADAEALKDAFNKYKAQETINKSED